MTPGIVRERYGATAARACSMSSAEAMWRATSSRSSAATQQS